jgi:hypothetical protein
MDEYPRRHATGMRLSTGQVFFLKIRTLSTSSLYSQALYAAHATQLTSTPTVFFPRIKTLLTSSKSWLVVIANTV